MPVRKFLVPPPLSLLTLAGMLCLSLTLRAQPSASELPDLPEPQNNSQPQSQTAPDKGSPTVRNFPMNVLRDQGVIWTSPVRVRAHDLLWLAPFGAGLGAAIATDQRAMNDVVSRDKSFNDANTNASNVLMGGMIAAPVAMYGLGLMNDNEHARETGILGAEAMVDGVVVEQGMKLIFWRERPGVDNNRGQFFQTHVGWDSSFPSSHTVIGWASAAVIASEYPKPLPVILSYGGASAIALTRVLGQQHFPSDVLVGSAAGWLVGRMVYRHHHRYAEQKGPHWNPVKPRQR